MIANPGETYNIVLKDNTVMKGVVLENHSFCLQVITPQGTSRSIPYSSVKYLEQEDRWDGSTYEMAFVAPEDDDDEDE